MERIQKALELARVTRAARKQNGEIKPDRSEAIPPGQLEEPIEYTETRRHEPVASELRDKRLVVGDEQSSHAQAYKMLRTQVLQRMRSNSWNSLAIVSPDGGSGKSLTAANLAISLAREVRHTVLLVDMSLRQPDLHTLFGYPATAGLSEYLTQDHSLNTLLFTPGIERLVVLPGGAPVSNSSDLLSSPRMARLVSELKTRYPERIIIFDMPAVLSGDDVLAFIPQVDAYLLVVEEGRTSREDIEHTTELLRATPNLGVVLNKSLAPSKGSALR